MVWGSNAGADSVVAGALDFHSLPSDIGVEDGDPWDAGTRALFWAGLAKGCSSVGTAKPNQSLPSGSAPSSCSSSASFSYGVGIGKVLGSHMATGVPSAFTWMMRPGSGCHHIFFPLNAKLLLGSTKPKGPGVGSAMWFQPFFPR